MSPTRIQLRRTKGWRKPEGAVVVARPSAWGNPFAPGGIYRFETLNGTFAGVVRDKVHAASLFREWAKYSDSENGRAFRDLARAELAGKDLACWCPLDQPCHGDVLLDIANGGQS